MKLPVTRQRIAAPVATSPLPLHESTNRYKITKKNETSIPKKPKQLAAWANAHQSEKDHKIIFAIKL